MGWKAGDEVGEQVHALLLVQPVVALAEPKNRFDGRDQDRDVVADDAENDVCVTTWWRVGNTGD